MAHLLEDTEDWEFLLKIRLGLGNGHLHTVDASGNLIVDMEVWDALGISSGVAGADDVHSTLDVVGAINPLNCLKEMDCLHTLQIPETLNVALAWYDELVVLARSRSDLVHPDSPAWVLEENLVDRRIDGAEWTDSISKILDLPAVVFVVADVE